MAKAKGLQVSGQPGLHSETLSYHVTSIHLIHIINGRQWLTPVILATQEAEIRRTVVQSQLGQVVLKTLS
jgi:hypothetical protein